ncbi:hypothetical protein D6789_00165 [Candidatus Woesearchaeota archaeon]|nr:MAG: hypothetical protein D6789_00165 [Candidatus Woesearchaeota archaeon]
MHNSIQRRTGSLYPKHLLLDALKVGDALELFEQTLQSRLPLHAAMNIETRDYTIHRLVVSGLDLLSAYKKGGEEVLRLDDATQHFRKRYSRSEDSLAQLATIPARSFVASRQAALLCWPAARSLRFDGTRLQYEAVGARNFERLEWALTEYLLLREATGEDYSFFAAPRRRRR